MDYTNEYKEAVRSLAKIIGALGGEFGSALSTAAILQQAGSDPVDLWEPPASRFVHHRERYRGMWLELEPDDVTDNNPRQWGNDTVMVCMHRRYTLGDVQPGDAAEYFDRVKAESGKYGFVSLPLYLYDHSGITMSTEPFSCPWDSGQVGRIYMTFEQAYSAFGTPKKKGLGWDGPAYSTDDTAPPQTLRERAMAQMRSEVQIYDDYLCGNAVVVVVRDPLGEVVDSCGGFYPSHGEGGSVDYDYAIQEGWAMIDSLVGEAMAEIGVGSARD
jgi:hypothetical protein